jgi:hypothetical protein
MRQAQSRHEHIYVHSPPVYAHPPSALQQQATGESSADLEDAKKDEIIEKLINLRKVLDSRVFLEELPSAAQ